MKRNIETLAFIFTDERCGNLALVLKDFATVANVRSQFKHIIHSMYLNPPHHGARVVATILRNEGLRREW